MRETMTKGQKAAEPSSPGANTRQRIIDAAIACIEQLLGPGATKSKKRVMGLIYFVMRDFWLGLRIEEVSAPPALFEERLRGLEPERDLLIRALVPLVEEVATPPYKPSQRRRERT